MLYVFRRPQRKTENLFQPGHLHLDPANNPLATKRPAGTPLRLTGANRQLIDGRIAAHAARVEAELRRLVFPVGDFEEE